MSRNTLGERLYRILLRFYPGEFRDDYEREMLLAFRERLSHDRGAGVGAVLRLWAQLLADSIVRAPGEHLDVLRQDLRYAVRSLSRAPLFTLTVIATLALGVGANTAIFSVVHAVALRPLPYESADRLVRIWERNESLSITGFAVSLPNFVTWHERAQTMELAGWRGGSVTLRSTSEPVRVPSVTISPNYFNLVGAKPVAGRAFVAADAEPGAERVALIRDSLWRSYFGGDHRAIGSAVTIGPEAHTIVGVIAEDSVPLAAEFYMPLRVDPANGATRQSHRQRDRAGQAGIHDHPGAAGDGSDCSTARGGVPEVEPRLGYRDVDGVRLARAGGNPARIVRAARRRLLRAADRVRQRREPDAGACRLTETGGRRPHGDRRRAPAPGAPGAD